MKNEPQPSESESSESKEAKRPILESVRELESLSLTLAHNTSLVVVGKGGATEFIGRSVGLLIERAVYELLARHQTRLLIGLDWVEGSAATFDDWLAAAIERREFIVTDAHSGPQGHDHHDHLPTQAGPGRGDH